MSHHFWDWNKEWYGEISFPGGSVVKNMPAMQKSQVWSLGGEDPLEKEIATCCSILAWEIPWTEEMGRLQSMEWQSQTLLSNWGHMHRDINSPPVGSRKSYKCVKQNFCLKTEQTDGQNLFFFWIVPSKEISSLFWGRINVCKQPNIWIWPFKPHLTS